MKGRCRQLTHRGPLLLAQFLAMRTLKERRDALKGIESDLGHSLFRRFDDSLGYPFCCHDAAFVHPADKYRRPDILKELSGMPNSEQPSGGWKWFCDQYEIDFLGIGPDKWWGSTWDVERDHRAGHELRWGFPFWDKERLVAWEVITCS